MIVKETSKTLTSNDKPEMSKGEFLRFLGIQLLMSTLTGSKKNDWWSSAPIELNSEAPYRLGGYMSKSSV